VIPTERTAKTQSLRTGIFATLPVLLCAVVGLLAFSAAPALAAAPEAPEEVTVQAPVHATEATFHGFLNPKASEPGKPGTYEFLYKKSPTVCTGGSRAPSSPAISLGGPHEEVSETVTGLEAGATYTVCLLARNGTKVGENEALSTPAVTFTTATPAEKPETEPATGETSSTAILHGVLNPLGSATTKAGWYFAYNTEATCTGSKEQQTGHEAELEGKALPVPPLGSPPVEIGGLEPHQKYKVCLVATNDAGEATVGNEVLFTTKALPPTIASESTSGVKSTGATLDAEVNPNNEATSYTFEYSTTENGAGVLTGAIVEVKDTSPVEGYPTQPPVSVPTDTLNPGETYYYRVVAENAQSNSESRTVGYPEAGVQSQSFTTVPTPTTEAVTAPTATTATFNGHLTPLNPSVTTQYHFDYDLGGGACTNEHETSPVEAGMGAGTEVKATANVTGLQPHHEYTVCLVTSNASGSQEGTPVHFTTAIVAPTIESESAPSEHITSSEATLEAQVNPNNQKTTYTFEYATSEAAIGTVGATVLPGAALEGFGPQTASAATGAVLSVGETYYYRVVVTNTETSAVIDGTIQSFTPQGAPLVGSGEALSITDTTVALTGTVNPAGAATKYHVAYVDAAEYEPGTADPYIKGKGTLEADAGAGNTAVAVGPLEVGELLPGVTYDYALVATSSLGTKIGPNATFTTASTPPILTGVSVSAVTESAATISATLQARGLQTRWELRLGTTPGSRLFQAAGSTAGAGAEPIEVNVGSLAAGTTYYYKLIAVNPDGTAETPEASFTTAPGAGPPTQAAAVPLLTLPNVKFPEEAAQSVTTTPKSLTNAQKLKNALKACHKQAKGKRAACEAQARKRFGPVKKAKRKGKQ
jgi:hypothetical protein